jgi:hypothetical protein
MDAPFDRGEIDRASLDATERLRARLAERPVAAPPPRRTVLPWVLAGALFVFTAGMIANPWFERSIRTRLPFDTAPATTVTAVPAAAPPAAAGAVPAMPPGERLARTEAQIEASAEQVARDAERIDQLNARVAALDARLESEAGRTEAASTAAVAAADRAQGMIAILLARQAIESGRRLGSAETVLRASFEARYPGAVASISALGAAPVTLAMLQRDFARIKAPNGEARLDWWQALTNTVQGMVSPQGEASAAPQAAAAKALARGDVATAASHLRRLPSPRPAAVTAWLAAADRLQAGQAALTVLETAAITLPIPVTAPTDGDAS